VINGYTTLTTSLVMW